jgi:outer membrane receptor for ferrienterochelin and colicins
MNRYLSFLLTANLAAAALHPLLADTDERHRPIVDLDSVVITGTRTERLVSESPVKTERILAQDMGAYQVTTLKDAFKLIPTARFENECQNCGVNQIQLLGLSTEYTAILFDGAPLYSGLAKVYGADLFPAIFIDRLEVVKGGSSVLYGPEAMAGVVNLITTDPVESSWQAALSYESILGDASEWESTFKGTQVGPGGKHYVTGYGLVLDRDGLDLGTDGFTDIPRFQSKVVGVQAGWKPIPEGSFKGTYQYMDQQHRGGDLLDGPEEQSRVAESLAHEIHLGQLSWRHRISPMTDYSLGVSTMRIQRISFYGSRGDNEQRAWEDAGFEGDVTDAFIDENQDLVDALARKVWGKTQNNVLYLDSQVNHYLTRHTLSYGMQYRYESLDDASRFDADIPHTKDSFSNFGIFLQDQWMLGDQWELVPGIRYDQHDNVSGSILSPRVAVRYRSSDSLTARFSWSTGFNAPGAFNEDAHIGVNNGGAIFLVNDPDLEEERSTTWSIGAEYQPGGPTAPWIWHTQVHYTELKDAFEIDDSGEKSGDPYLWYRYNGPDASVLVWENNLTWKWTEHLRLDAGVSWVHARISEEIERVTGLVTDEFPKRPEWTGHLGLSFAEDSGLSAHLLYNYTGSMLAWGADADIWRHTPSFHVLDVGIGKTWSGLWKDGDLTLSLGIQNLLDHRQKDLQDNGEERDPTYLYGPVQPRTYSIRVAVRW